MLGWAAGRRGGRPLLVLLIGARPPVVQLQTDAKMPVLPSV